MAGFLAGHLGFGSAVAAPFVPLSAIRLPAPRLRPPAALAACCEAGDHARARHAYGSSYRDVVRGLGGMVATRAAGHFATLATHIDDLVESVRALTPAGVWESRRLPGSGAGVSPDRMLIGSEGTLGVITEAWVRVRQRAGASVCFPGGFAAGAQAVRALALSGLHPANCRLIDPGEARLTGAGDGSAAVLVLGFESPALPVKELMTQALECCGDHGGRWEATGGGGAGSGDGASDTWRDAFLRAPYLRDTFVAMGVLSETFESAITCDRFDELHAAVQTAVGAAMRAVCGAGTVTCRLTHVYPDGAAPYWTVLAPATPGSELAPWAASRRRRRRR